MNNCPSCGRKILFEEKYSKVISCQYCNSVLEFGDSELTKIGDQNPFIDFPSQFEVGKTTTWNDKKLQVKGQLRFEYDGGFFDEFFVVMDGKKISIREDDGTLKIVKTEHEIQKDLDISLFNVGENADFFGKKIFVQEKGIFELTSMKGEINNQILPGKRYDYVDGIIDGKMFFIEKSQDGTYMRISSEV